MKVSVICGILLYLIILTFIIIYVANKILRHLQTNKRVCFSDKMSLNERYTLTELLTVVDKILSNNNIDWIPTGGSLLSVYRHKKLFIKWDDDYDMTVVNNKSSIVVPILETQLPKYNCSIIFHKNWGNGLLYKIFFNSDNSEHDLSNVPSDWGGNWPFIDLFINVPEKNSWSSPHNLTEDEYPLMIIQIDNLNIKVPTNGKRTKQFFKEQGLFSECQEQNWSHKYNKRDLCDGPKKLKCDILKE